MLTRVDASSNRAICANDRAELADKASGTATDDHVKEIPFPVILHAVVSNENTNHCIHWLPCGTRFVLSDKDEFAAKIMPHYFDVRGSAKFSSFTRRLKRWLFKRVPSGPQMGAYYHEGFIREKPDMAEKIVYPAKEHSGFKSIKQQRRASTGSCSSKAACLSDISPVPFDSIQSLPEELDSHEMCSLLMKSNLFKLKKEEPILMTGVVSPSPQVDLCQHMESSPLHEIEEQRAFGPPKGYFHGPGMRCHSTSSLVALMSMMPNWTGSAPFSFPSEPTLSATAECILQNKAQLQVSGTVDDPTELIQFPH